MPVFSRSLGSISANDPNAIRLLANHIRIMQEELEYRLMFLDSSNISEINADQTNIITSKGGLIQLLNETEESVAKLSVKNDEIVASVEDINGKYTELKVAVDGVSITDETGTTRIKGSSIETESMVLSGSIKFVNSSGSTTTLQGAINSAGGISSNEAREITETYIDSWRVSSPVLEGANIYGGTFWDLNKKTKLVLNPNNSPSGNADLRLYSGNNVAFRLNDDIMGSVTWYSYDYQFLVTGQFGTSPQGEWDFSGATTTGLYLTFS